MIFLRRALQLSEPKRPKEVGRTTDSKYYRYHRMANHPVEKCVTRKGHIVQHIEDGTIILDFNGVVETDHIFCQTKRLSLI